jgi:hypothetical protein
MKKKIIACALKFDVNNSDRKMSGTGLPIRRNQAIPKDCWKSGSWNRERLEARSDSGDDRSSDIYIIHQLCCRKVRAA